MEGEETWAEKNTSVVGRIMPLLKDMHVLIPRICEYFTLRGKRYIEDVIKLKSLEMGKIWIIQEDSIYLQGSLKREAGESELEEM